MIGQRQSDNRDGFKCIPFPALAVNATSTITTPFTNVYLAIHVQSSGGTLVAGAGAAGATSITLDVAGVGTLLVWGDGDAGTATISLT